MLLLLSSCETYGIIIRLYTGDLYSWGMGSSGQLGTGEEEDVEIPTLVKGKQLEGKTVIRVAGGGQHTLSLATIHPVKEKTAG